MNSNLGQEFEDIRKLAGEMRACYLQGHSLLIQILQKMLLLETAAPDSCSQDVSKLRESLLFIQKTRIKTLDQPLSKNINCSNADYHIYSL